MLQQLVNGIITGSLYALIAVGLTMVYGILRILHIAHAAVYVSGAYLGLVGYTYTGSLILALAFAVGGCMVFGWLIQRYLYTPLLKEERIVPLIASVGCYIFFEDLFRLLGGPYIRAFTVKLWFDKVIFLDTVMTAHQVLIIVVTALCLLAIYLIITQTKLGLAWQATAQDMDTARVMGVNIGHVVNLNFLIASAIAAIAGVLTAINYNSVLPTMGSVPAYKTFAIVVLGGMGSIPGTIAAGLIVGLVETVMSAYFGFIMPRDSIAFTAMILILAFRPQGLFGGGKGVMSWGYLITIGDIVGIYVILTLSLNIISGYAGQPSLGQAAFFGIGAYASAMLTTKTGVNFWLALPLSMAAAGAVGALMGIISLRIKGDFLAVSTIGVNFVIVSFFEYWDFFGGAYGISGIKYPTLFGLTLSREYYFVLILVFVVLAALFSLLITRSWLGLALEAIREDEDAAEASGINCKKFKIVAFSLGCAMAGLAGVLYAHFMRFVVPVDFSFPISITIVSMMVVGGTGTIRGAILGAMLMAALPEILRPLANFRLLFYGGLMVLITRFQPQGLFGTKAFIVRSLFGSWVGAGSKGNPGRLP